MHPIFVTQHVDTLPDDDPLKTVGNNIADRFTSIVDLLRDPKQFPNPEINKLLSLTWRLVEHRVVKVAATAVPSLSFMVTTSFAAFLCPFDWLQQWKRQPIFCIGGVISNASQCRDYWNQRLLPTIETSQRALAYETEYLLTIQREQILHLNSWQEDALKEFPQGLQSAQHLLYPTKAFLDAS